MGRLARTLMPYGISSNEVLNDIRDRIHRQTWRVPADREPRPHHALRSDVEEVEMTIHPIVYVAARRPQLLVAHAKAYGDLLLEEGRRALSSLILHAALYAVAGVLGLLGLVFGGVALLLYAAVSDELRNGWVLVALPCASMLVAGACVIVARALPVNVTLDVVGRQVKADIDMIHAAGPP